MNRWELMTRLLFHQKWWDDEPDGVRADLIGADLFEADLFEANLVRANLTEANLVRANLVGARLVRSALTGAKLTGADLTRADLFEANLTEANLTEANLVRADLTRANLTEANLVRANLTGADLFEANLTGAKYSLLAVLTANWGNVSDKLCAEMMRWDAAAHPHPEKFQTWADGGTCPLNSASVHRLLQFSEKRELYRAGPPTMTLWQLWAVVAREKGIKI